MCGQIVTRIVDAGGLRSGIVSLLVFCRVCVGCVRVCMLSVCDIRRMFVLVYIKEQQQREERVVVVSCISPSAVDAMLYI